MLNHGPFKVGVDIAVKYLSGESVDSWVNKRTQQRLIDIARSTGWNEGMFFVLDFY